MIACPGYVLHPTSFSSSVTKKSRSRRCGSLSISMLLCTAPAGTPAPCNACIVSIASRCSVQDEMMSFSAASFVLRATSTRKRHIIQQARRTHYSTECMPLFFTSYGNCQPPIVAQARINSMRGMLIVTVAAPCRLSSVVSDKRRCIRRSGTPGPQPTQGQCTDPDLSMCDDATQSL